MSAGFFTSAIGFSLNATPETNDRPRETYDGHIKSPGYFSDEVSRLNVDMCLLRDKRLEVTMTRSSALTKPKMYKLDTLNNFQVCMLITHEYVGKQFSKKMFFFIRGKPFSSER